ncbi:FAD-binding oxidoreductase [Caballeronia sp. INDeC2]|uniref:FAD-binding oxidoreductase n=1 Tax=Caballeronia sp. INDeC2 TaxID=2921747 RepID=UPI002027A1F0|nr:FAD-binding oxidoreductase [Caballeronia sp. INDeC2]
MSDKNIDWNRLADELDPMRTVTSGGQLRGRSRDFSWYSPILDVQLKDCIANLIVFPHSEEDVMRVAACVARWRVPLTVRGGGTGNYGQCVPLQGGVVMDMTELKRVIEVAPGSVRVEAGARIGELQEAVRASGQDLLMFPSTLRVATIGGFIAGGYAGIGSIRHGILKDRDNVRGMRVVTVEDNPRVIELRGADIQKVHHAFGTNGIITQLDLTLEPAQDWLHTITLFETYGDALRFCTEASTPAVDLYLLTSVEKGFAPFYAHLGERFPLNRHAVFAMVSPRSIDAYRALSARHGGVESLCMNAAALEKHGLPPAYECAYNHTTLQALKTDRQWTYLQIAHAQPFDIALCEELARQFGDEIYWHHEFAKQFGEYQVFGIPLVRYTTPQRQYEIMRVFESHGCATFDPHVVTIEDGGMKEIDLAQIDFKRLADPHGLLNPGKMRGWDELAA